MPAARTGEQRQATSTSGTGATPICGSVAECGFAALFEATPQALLVCDVSGRIRLVNASAEALTGYARSALVGANVDLLLPPARRQHHAAQRLAWFDRPAARPMAAGRLLSCRRADGSEVPVEIRLSPMSTGAERLVLAAIVDISARQLLERRFELAVAAAPIGMLLLDGRGRIVSSNRACDQLFGYAADQLAGQPADLLLPERFRLSPRRRRAFFRLPMPRRLGARATLVGRHQEGAELPIEVGLNAVPASTERLYLAVVTDLREHHRLAQLAARAQEVLEERVRERTEALEQSNRAREALLQDLLAQRAVLEHLSREDPLTGLANRRAFDERLGAEVQRAVTASRPLPLALAMFDLDHFKTVNDVHGHACGDAVLRTCAELLHSACRPDDVLARYGGEEFVLALPDTGLDAACALCERLRRAVAGYDWPRLRPGLQVTLSVGVATLSPGLDAAALLALADARLYAAKREGRNRVVPQAGPD